MRSSTSTGEWTAPIDVRNEEVVDVRRGEVVVASCAKPQAVTARTDPNPATFTPPDSRKVSVRHNKNTVTRFEIR